MATRVDKVGFFHFGENHADPFGSLHDALSESEEDVADSLIVLPEGFNIGKLYRDPAQSCDFDLSILPQLKALSEKSGVTFVSGLIVDDNSGINPPYSSAYLIDGSGYKLMCHKALPDFSGNYTTCEAECDIENPIQHHNVSVAAVICRDIEDSQRCRDLLTARERINHECQIVCIPACIGSHFSGHSAPLDEVVVVLANSDPEGRESFIAAQGVELLGHRGTDNKVFVKALDELNVN